MTGDQFMSFYNRCSSILHAGAGYDPLLESSNIDAESRRIGTIVDRIVKLLDRHVMRHYDDEFMWIVQMESGIKDPTVTPLKKGARGGTFCRS